jgi:DNA end-binding protein Ku
MASRPYWSGFLRFSLVTVPVQLFSATSTGSEKITLNQLHAACHNRIQYKKTCPQHGELKNEEIVTGYEFDDGRYVIVDAGEIEKLRSPKEKGINIVSFITDGLVDPRYFEGKHYHLTPDGPIAQKPYAVLHKAMAQGKRAALCEMVIRGKKYVGMIRPLDNLLTMSILEYAANVKKLEEFQASAPRLEVTPQELKLATQIIEQLAEDEPDLGQFKDDYAANLQTLIEAKIAGKEVVEQPPDAESPQVINLMEALERSLAAAKKPAGGKPPKMVAPGTAGKAKEARKRKTS